MFYLYQPTYPGVHFHGSVSLEQNRVVANLPRSALMSGTVVVGSAQREERLHIHIGIWIQFQ